MLGLSDFLTLQGQNPASRILKPWWDIFTDYVIRVLLLISVVTGAVSFYVKGITCVPAITCPVDVTSPFQNSLIQNTCASFYNSNRYLENISEIIVLTKFPDRSLNLFVNSECKRLGVAWFSRFLPFVLFYQAGACLVFQNIWFTLSASMTEQFSNLVNECYDSSNSNLADTGREAKAKKVEELKRTIAEFVSNAWNLEYVNRKVVEVINEPWKTDELQRKVEKFAKELPESFARYFQLRHIYAMELLLQCLLLATFLLMDFIMERNDGDFKCNINTLAVGLVQDHFICSYAHSSLYQWSLNGFFVCLILYLLVNIRRAVWFFKIGCGGFTPHGKRNEIPPGDFAFLLNLLRMSNPVYLDPVSNMLFTVIGKDRLDEEFSVIEAIGLHEKNGELHI